MRCMRCCVNVKLEMLKIVMLKIFLSLQRIYYELMKTKFNISLVFALSSWWKRILGKN